MSGSQRRTTKGREQGGRGVCLGPPQRCVSAGPSCFPERPRSLISLPQLHLFSAGLCTLAPTPASPRSGFSSRVPPGPERGASWTVCLPPQEPQASQHERFWLFFPTTRGSPRRNFLIPLLKWDLKKWRVRCLTNISLVERVSCLTASLWPKRLCYDSGSTTCNSTVSQSSPSQTMCRCLGKDEQAG